MKFQESSAFSTPLSCSDFFHSTDHILAYAKTYLFIKSIIYFMFSIPQQNINPTIAGISFSILFTHISLALITVPGTKQAFSKYLLNDLINDCVKYSENLSKAFLGILDLRDQLRGLNYKFFFPFQKLYILLKQNAMGDRRHFPRSSFQRILVVRGREMAEKSEGWFPMSQPSLSHASYIKPLAIHFPSLSFLSKNKDDNNDIHPNHRVSVKT